MSVSDPQPQQQQRTKERPSPSFRFAPREVADASGLTTPGRPKGASPLSVSRGAVARPAQPAQRKNAPQLDFSTFGLDSFDPQNHKRWALTQAVLQAQTFKEFRAAAHALREAQARDATGNPDVRAAAQDDEVLQAPRSSSAEDVSVPSVSATRARFSGSPVVSPPKNAQEFAQPFIPSSPDVAAQSNTAQKTPQPKAEEYVTIANQHVAGSAIEKDDSLTMKASGGFDKYNSMWSNGRSDSGVRFMQGLDLAQDDVATAVTKTNIPKVGEVSESIMTFKIQHRPMEALNLETQSKSADMPTNTQPKSQITEALSPAAQPKFQTMGEPNQTSPPQSAYEATNVQNDQSLRPNSEKGQSDKTVAIGKEKDDVFRRNAKRFKEIAKDPARLEKITAQAARSKASGYLDIKAGKVLHALGIISSTPRGLASKSLPAPQGRMPITEASILAARAMGKERGWVADRAGCSSKRIDAASRSIQVR